MLSRIHIDQGAIRGNKKNGTNLPPISVKTYKDNRKGHSAIIVDKDGNVVARVVYRPDRPLSCGARLWVETDLEVQVTLEDNVTDVIKGQESLF